MANPLFNMLNQIFQLPIATFSYLTNIYGGDLMM